MGGCAGKHQGTDIASNCTEQKSQFGISATHGGEQLNGNAAQKNGIPSSTKLYDLPLDVLDVILQKSYLCLILHSSMKPTDDEVILKSLRSVDSLFSRRFTRQRLKKAICRHLITNDVYKESKKRSPICRNNRDDLLKNIQPNEEDQLVDSVLHLNCITKEQTEFIQRQRSTREKTAQMFRVVRCVDDAKYSNFADCPRQTSQTDVAEVVENGGVVRPISINFTRRIEIPGNEYVYGMAKLRKRIYVLSQPSSDASKVIRVFEDREPFRLQKEIEIEHLRCPVDIVSCERQNCLYVSDYGLKYVWKITREKDGRHSIVKFLLTGNEPFTLSVSSYGELLMVSTTWSVLNIYGSDAKLISSIQLPKDIKYPRHALETSTGNFIILHWWLHEEKQKDGVCWSGRGQCEWKWVVSELTRDGHLVIRRFIPSNQTQQLNGPEYLLLSNSGEQVFVADTGNDRVILLGSDLKWHGNLCSVNEKENKEAKIQKPYRMCYDEENRRMIIVVCSSAVDVYSLSRRNECEISTCPVPSQTVNIDSKTLDPHQQILTNEHRFETPSRYEMIRLIP